MKGQTQQVFIYIMVILVVGAVLLFGFKAIDGLIKKACNVDKSTFQTGLKNLIDGNSDYGTINPISIKSPCGYERLCILNTSGVNTDFLYTVNINNHLMVDEVLSGTGNNVFLLKGNEIVALYELDIIEVKEHNNFGYICFNATGGSFHMQLEGIGKGKVQISEQS